MRPLRVLYSFPHRIGASRICETAWHQVRGLHAAGAAVTAMPASVAAPLPEGVMVRPTLSLGRLRLPFRLLGSRRTFGLHDEIVARRLERIAGSIDIVHAWPMASLRTLETASRLGIPTVLERPNAHTRFAYEVVRQECERVGVELPMDHEHAFNDETLHREEAEYAAADHLLCPSQFVLDSFVREGVPRAKLLQHRYGFDPQRYFPSSEPRPDGAGLNVLFAGGCAPRKGLHHALEAWLASPASRTGTLRIAGAFVAGYAEKLASQLSHPSVAVLGHRSDMPTLMRGSDVLVLPTVEEGSALVTYEARGSGCVLAVSDASGAYCRHMHDALVHPAGQVQTLRDHLTALHEDRGLLARLRAASLDGVPDITWRAAGDCLLDAYREAIASRPRERSRPTSSHRAMFAEVRS